MVHGDWCLWSRSRPEAGGRQVVEQGWLDGSGAVRAVSPADVDVRSRVHEYGGGAFAVVAGGLAVVDAADGAIWWSPTALDGPRTGTPPGGADWRRLTPPAPDGVREHHGDLCEVPGRPVLVAVRERVWGRGADGSADEIVAVAVGGAPHVVVLQHGRDFFAAPRPSPGGDRLAYLCWDHPRMPWDGCELHVAPLPPAGDEEAGGPGVVGVAGGPGQRRAAGGPGSVRVAGGDEEAVGQPQWVGDVLWFASDRAGFFQPWTWTPHVGARRVCEREAEFHAPDWALGQRSMAPLDARAWGVATGAMAVRFRHEGRDRVGVLDAASGTLQELDQPWVSVAALAASGGSIVVLGSTPTDATGVGVLGAGGGHRWVRPPAPVPLPATRVSSAGAVSFPGEDGATVHMLVYPPAGVGAAAGGRGRAPGAPLMVVCHGGPTGAAEPGLDLQVQLWTSRGFLVAAVDYRGSSGYGRAYRRALDGRWGELDAADVRAAARHLVASGHADGRRCAVRGSSAGGLTALRAATPGGPFGAVVAAYGVTDLRALAADTHAFEAHYLDSLVGPLPAARERYEERSPALHPERIGAAVLLLQGSDDPVVPPAQAAALAGALRGLGVRCDHVVFDGEGHGFRRPETVRAAAAAELAFVGEVLGLGDLGGTAAGAARQHGTGAADGRPEAPGGDDRRGEGAGPLP